ncbi:hypothetical protein [Halomontanus rarus]|uniref:hypothetical protein n=1 Tax=Halomontanus rarus TaxID=3034020 RepID=UPI001A99CD50
MYDDDSRGLESPDRPHASTDDWNTRARPDGGTPAPEDSSDDSTHPNDVDPDTAGYRLEVIDHQATKLLEALADDRTDEPHEATRHLREIRAEVEWVRQGLCESPGESGSVADSTGDSEARTDESDRAGDLEDRTDESEDRADDSNGDTISGNSARPGRDASDANDENAKDDPDGANHTAYSTDDGVPMVVRRGPHVTTVLGPDPAAYERSLESGGPDAGDGDGERDRDGDGDGDEDGSDTDDDAPDGDDSRGAGEGRGAGGARETGDSRSGGTDCVDGADGTDNADGTDDTDGTDGTIDTSDPDVFDDTGGVDDTIDTDDSDTPTDTTDTEPTPERSDTRDQTQPHDGGDRDDE